MKFWLVVVLALPFWIAFKNSFGIINTDFVQSDEKNTIQ